MKKVSSILLVLVLSFTLLACGEGATSGTLVIDAESTDASASSQSDNYNGEDILSKYVSQYDAKAYYQDMLVSFQYVLVTDSQVISLNAIEGAEDMKAIALDEIAIAQKSQVADIYTVTISSKNGDTITVRLSSQDATSLLKDIGK